MGNEVPKMQPDVEKEFDCVKVLPGEVLYKNKLIDIRKIDLATARKLHEDKFPYLKRKSGQIPPHK